MQPRDPLARLMTLAFHLNLATAAAMVLWTAWTGYLVATGQIRPTPTSTRATHAVPTSIAPARAHVPACRCHRDELQVRVQSATEAA